VLLQITAHAERLAVLDEREATHHQQTTGHLAAVSRELTATSDRLGEVLTTAARQAAVLDSLGGLDQQVATLADRLALLVAGQDKGDDPDAGSYRPHRRHAGGSSAVTSVRPRWPGCVPGWSRSTAQATGTSPARSALAGTSTRCACSAWIG
jgi:hypothetical protein